MPALVGPKYLARKGSFYHQLSQMTAAGLGLIQTLAASASSPPDRSWRAPLRRIDGLLQDGHSFGQALTSAPEMFSPFELAVLLAAEESGRLPETFAMLARYFEDKAALARRFLGLVLYPCFILHVLILLFPLGALQGLVLQGKVVGYVAGKVMVLAPLYFAVWMVLYASSSDHARPWRAWVERVLHWVPYVGQARRQLALARLAGALEAMIRSGVPIIRAWEYAGPASGSPALQEAIERFLPQLREGGSPAEALRRSRKFPEMFVSHYLTGETSGSLDDSLRWMYRYYEEEGGRRMKQAVAGGAGLIYLIVVLLVAWQVLSFYIGYFKQIEEVIPK